MQMTGIEFHAISKYFAGKRALCNVNLAIEKGTVHAIVGENGAGKSTLMNILNGVCMPSSGSISMGGKKITIKDPLDATRYGIGMVHQHFMLINVLNVWQNIALGAESINRFKLLKMKEMRSKISRVCEEYGVTFNLDESVGNLTVGEQQRIEIIKVLYRKAEYIILDEPTAVLTPEEIENLFASIERFKAMGKTVIFISHKIEEVLRISDRITVLRQGELVGTLERKDATADKLVEMMVGREIDFEGSPLQTPKGEMLLELDNVCTRQEGFGCALDHISFNLCKGEVLGFAGVDGNGQLELVQALMGLMNVTEGSIRFCGNEIRNESTYRIRRKGISCIPPDRQDQGLVLDSPVFRNMVMGFENIPQFKKFGLLNPTKVVDRSAELAKDYDVRCESISQDIRGLSGGNQQKVILARECGVVYPQLIVAANPTRGLDVGAIEFVYQALEKLKKQGKSILLISTELSEILRLSDRIAILHRGKIMDIIENKNVDIQNIGKLMMGIRQGDENV